MNYLSRILAHIGEFFSILDSASAVAGALRVRQQPNSEDLRRLGIEHADFGPMLSPHALNARDQLSSKDRAAPLPRVSGTDNTAALAA